MDGKRGFDAMIKFWVALLTVCISTPALAVDLTAYTEEWPPYNYLNKETREVHGLSTEVLRAVCAEARIQCEYRVVPWARAYRTALQTPGTMVYTTARKPERERDFVWIGPIAPRTTWLYVRSNLASAVNGAGDVTGLRIGVVREEAAATDLAAMGVSATAVTTQASNSDVLRLLDLGSIDAMVDTELGMAWNLRSLALPASLVSRRIKVSDAGAYFFAINPSTHPEVIRKLQYAFEKLQRNGKVAAILRSYMDKGK